MSVRVLAHAVKDLRRGISRKSSEPSMKTYGIQEKLAEVRSSRCHVAHERWSIRDAERMMLSIEVQFEQVPNETGRPTVDYQAG